MNEIIDSPVAAAAAYETFFSEGRLIRNTWTHVRDGRQLACALGVLGVANAASCPASVMPAWLAYMVPSMFDESASDEEAFAWGRRFYAQLARLNGRVPDRVRDLLLADYVLPIAVESLRGQWLGKIQPHISAVQALLRRRALGEEVREEIDAAAAATAAALWATTAADSAAAADSWAAGTADAAAAAVAARWAAGCAASKRIADGLIALMTDEPHQFA